MSGYQGRYLPGDLVLEGLSSHVPAQIVHDEAAHAPALATLRAGDVGREHHVGQVVEAGVRLRRFRVRDVENGPQVVPLLQNLPARSCPSSACRTATTSLTVALRRCSSTASGRGSTLSSGSRWPTGISRGREVPWRSSLGAKARRRPRSPSPGCSHTPR
jgi:hypothetical protein